MSTTDICTSSKKVRSFVVMAISIIVCVLATTMAHTPDNVATQALWIIGFGGLFAIGGQSLIDSIEKWSTGRSSIAISTTASTETIKKEA